MNRVLLLLSLSLSFLLVNAQNDSVDIDEWQVMKVEAARDPFANGNQFTINFANYTEEESFAWGTGNQSLWRSATPRRNRH